MSKLTDVSSALYRATILTSRYYSQPSEARRNSMKTTYKIDPAHSTAQFVVRHMMITNVRGGFSGVQGTVVYDPQKPTASSVEAVIDASTINPLEPAHDTHLKSADFLDVV